MKLLKDSDCRTFEQLCSLSQGAVQATMIKYLNSKYDEVAYTKDYLYATGDIPIALVAHMDTVFKYPADEVFYDRQKNVMWAPNGLGADDRAGVFAIIQIIKRGLRPHIILTTDEEVGARGASVLSTIPCPFEDLRYIIQLDRRGSNDCVFYDCDNPAFVDYVESFGFVEAIGSFSDISVICPAWKIAGVNLSIGYRDEHSTSEVLFVGQMLHTIDRVCAMLQASDIPSFEYIPSKYAVRWYSMCLPEDENHCSNCGKEFLPEELIEVKTVSGAIKYYCIDCVAIGKVDFCCCCGEAYEHTGDPKKTFNMCEDCYYDTIYEYK